MKITEIKLYRLRGRIEAESFELERVAKALDIYPGFAEENWGRPKTDKDGKTGIEDNYIKVLTDEGIEGLYGPIASPIQLLIIQNSLRPFLIGRDPARIEALWEMMLRLDRHGRTSYFMHAISAVDNALWDIRGKLAGKPVCELLSDKPRRKLTAYASCIGCLLDAASVASKVKELKDEGYKAQKWFFRWGPGSGEAGKKKNLELVRAAREAAGEGYPLMFDCWMSWDDEYAIQMARELEQYRPTWLEEPLLANRLDGYRKISEKTSVPLAAGEHLYTRWECEPYLASGAIAYLQADPDWCGGISELVRIAELAAKHGVKLVPHGHSVPAAAHLVASRGEESCPWVEYLLFYQKRQQHFLKHDWRPVKGELTLPAAPGLGIEWDEGKIEGVEETVIGK